MADVSPGNYPRKINPAVLTQVLMGSFLRLASGLREILECYGGTLATRHLSTLSYALGSEYALTLTLAFLSALPQPTHEALLIMVLDSMAVTIPKTRRHNCKKFNNKTVGGGVLWSFCVTASRRVSPIKILRFIEGSWSDAKLMRSVDLPGDGPLYIMDRGFYAIDLLGKWLDERVRFIIRARGKDLVYQPVQTMESAGTLQAKPNSRRTRTITVAFNGIARIGAESRRGKRPIVRLLHTTLTTEKNGKTTTEDFILISHNLNIGAQELVDLYGRRWEIENFHRLLKRTIGLAHLYSFRQTGLKLLIATATLLAALLWLEPNASGTPANNLVSQLRSIIKEARIPLGRKYIWLPNTIGKNRWRHRR